MLMLTIFGGVFMIDREMQLIQGLADLTKAVASMQESLKSLTEVCYLLKSRVEVLEDKNRENK